MYSTLQTSPENINFKELNEVNSKVNNFLGESQEESKDIFLDKLLCLTVLSKGIIKPKKNYRKVIYYFIGKYNRTLKEEGEGYIYAPLRHIAKESKTSIKIVRNTINFLKEKSFFLSVEHTGQGGQSLYRLNTELLTQTGHKQGTNRAQTIAFKLTPEEHHSPPPKTSIISLNSYKKLTNNTRYLEGLDKQENQELVSFFSLLKENRIVINNKSRIELINEILKRYKITSKELFNILKTYVDYRKPKCFSKYLGFLLQNHDVNLDLLVSEFVESKERKEKGLASKKDAERAIKKVDDLRISNPQRFRKAAKNIALRYGIDLEDESIRWRFDTVLDTNVFREDIYIAIYSEIKDVEAQHEVSH